MTSTEFTRTNYFRTTNEKKLADLVDATMSTTGRLTLFRQDDYTGEIRCAFGGPGAILGVPRLTTGRPDFAWFLERLKRLIARGDACVIMTVGHEEMRSVSASAWIVTWKDTRKLDFLDSVYDAARDMLGNLGWHSQFTD